MTQASRASDEIVPLSPRPARSFRLPAPTLTLPFAVGVLSLVLWEFAVRATIIRMTAVEMNVTGSRGFTPATSDCMTLALSSETNSPAATPTPTRIMPRPSTSASTVAWFAPSAMRTPISLVRCETA